jgi:Flp pilus assembly protein TadG
MNERALSPQPRLDGPSRRVFRARRLAGSERGTAVVEFALITPILFALVLGIINFGRALDYYNQLTQLASQGARAAAVDRNPDGSGPPTANSIQSQLVNQYTTQPELKSGEHICITRTPSSVGDAVTVTASFSFSLWPTGVIPIPKPRLTTSSTERAEVVPLDASGNVNLGYSASCYP